MTRISFRKALADDAFDCAAILMEWVADTPWYPYASPDSASVSAMQERIAGGQVEIALDGPQVVGFMSLEAGALDCLYIARSHQRAGTGKALLDRCKEQHPGGFSLWTLAQNHGARRFYQREGMVETDRSDGARNEEGLPDIEFSWLGTGGAR